MSREILFRGKRVDNGQWEEGSLLTSDWNVDKYNRCYIVRSFADSAYVSNHEVIPETIGQYIGLKDSEGNNIFEDDVVSQNQLVVFESGLFGTTYIGNQQGVCGLSELRCKYMSVIGNIHDNTELIEK